MASSLSDEKTLTEALSIVEKTPDIERAIGKLRDLLNIDHIVYYLPKVGAAPYVRLTYPASWIKRYIEMSYAEIDPISREGSQRTLPFNWSELKAKTAAAASFLADAISHGVGPNGLTIPMSEYGHWALFSISFSRSDQEWTEFVAAGQPTLVQIAHRLHRRVVAEVFGEDRVK